MVDGAVGETGDLVQTVLVCVCVIHTVMVTRAREHATGARSACLRKQAFALLPPPARSLVVR